MEKLMSYKQFNTQNDVVNEGLFSTTKYDVLKAFSGKVANNKLIKELDANDVALKDFDGVLLDAGIDKDIVKYFNKVFKGQSKYQLITLDIKKVNDLLSKFDTMDKKVINDTVIYKLKTGLENLSKEAWLKAYNDIKKTSKKLAPKIKGVKDGEILVGGIEVKAGSPV